MIDDASCYFCISKQNLCYFAVPSNKVNGQHGRLLITYDNYTRIRQHHKLIG